MEDSAPESKPDHVFASPGEGDGGSFGITAGLRGLIPLMRWTGAWEMDRFGKTACLDVLHRWIDGDVLVPPP